MSTLSASQCSEPVRLGTGPGRWVLLATVLGSAVAMLDATVVNIALPVLGRDLGAGLGGLQWVVNGYAVTLAALILLGGSMGDRYGRRRIFVIGVIWFAAASLLCAVAPTVTLLIAARALQGIGGALLTPASLAIIQASFVHAHRPRAIGAWAGLGGVAGAVGPFVGGGLIEVVGWRWIFLINVPIAAVVAVVALRHVPESSNPRACRHLDLTGAGLCVLGLVGISYALIVGGESGANVPVVAAGVVGAAALLVFLVVERRSNQPMLPLGIFGSRVFSSVNTVTLAIYAALSGLSFFLVLHLQTVLGYSPLAAGTAMLPVTVIMLLLSARVGALAQRVGPRWPMTIGPIVAAAGMVLMLRIDTEAGYLADVLPAVVVFGLGLALTVTPLTSTALAAASSEHSGVASGVNNAVARTAGLLAVAVLPVAAGVSGNDYAQPAAFADGFRTAMLICAGLLVLGGVLSGLMVPSDILAEAATEQQSQPESARQPESAQPYVSPGPGDLAEHHRPEGHHEPDRAEPRSAEPASAESGHWCTHCAIDGPPLYSPRQGRTAPDNLE